MKQMYKLFLTRWQRSAITWFAGLLQFLELGCGGSPLQGYPAIIVYPFLNPAFGGINLTFLLPFY